MSGLIFVGAFVVFVSTGTAVLFYVRSRRQSQPEWLQKYWRKQSDGEGNIFWEQTDAPKVNEKN